MYLLITISFLAKSNKSSLSIVLTIYSFGCNGSFNKGLSPKTTDENDPSLGVYLFEISASFWNGTLLTKIEFKLSEYCCDPPPNFVKNNVLSE